MLFLLFPLDLPPVYTYPPITMGYKAGPSPPEARLAEQATAEVEPAQPDSKPLPHPCHIQPRTEEETKTDGDAERDCEAVGFHSGVAEEKDQRHAEATGCSIPEPESSSSGLLPCSSSSSSVSSAADSSCPATGKGPKEKLSVVAPGQEARLDEPELSKEEQDEEECGKEKLEEDEEEKTEPEPIECIVSVPGELGEEQREDEERGEHVEVVEEDDEESGRSPHEDLMELTRSPASRLTSDPVLPSTAGSAVQLQGAYMWSLELLIAAALCATRDALYPPVTAVRSPSPPPHHGMEILGELAELEIQQRSRQEKEKDCEGNLSFLNTKNVFFGCFF